MKRKKYVTSWERMGEERGEIKGEIKTLRKNISEVLSLRFGALPESITTFTQTVEDANYLQALLRRAVVCQSLNEFESQLEIAA